MKVQIEPYIVQRIRVKSRSKPDETHLVELFNDEMIVCDCIAGLYRKNCRHKKVANKYLKLKEYYATKERQMGSKTGQRTVL